MDAGIAQGRTKITRAAQSGAQRGGLRAAVTVVASFGTAVLLCMISLPSTSATATRVSAETLATARYGRVPLSFEMNRGQAADNVRFLARGPGYQMFLTGNGAVIRLDAGGSEAGAKLRAVVKPRSATLRIRFADANPTPVVTGEAPLAGKSNYFSGDDRAHDITDIPTFGKVRYRNLYPGIDLVYYGNPKHVESYARTLCMR